MEYDAKNLEHNYLSETLRPFYRALRRQGRDGRGPGVARPYRAHSLASKGEVTIHGSGRGPTGCARPTCRFVQSVRGRYYGWAAVNLDRTFDRGIVGAGDVQLSKPHGPDRGPR
ncbi:hypothetical protein [Streptomyces clavuligerus]|uniref:hypothetical protein n=1 Tax=Streptomyces clavuligerus TaxID=1901 RepID=UPI001F07EFC3|nr:hypothetical protein [Streptomyces clavuligerus]